MRLALVLALALIAIPAGAQTATELLQKGIYTQETVGDVDAAIKIYRQVLATAADSRAAAAQAQYRLGVCLLKKGDKAGATKAFETLIQQYPEEKELVARAREAMPAEPALLPSPWTEGEVLEYRLRLGGGMEIGSMFLSVERSQARPQNAIVQNRLYMSGAPAQWSQVEVDRDTMRPVSTSYISPVVGESTTAWEARQARFQPKGKELRIISLDGGSFDNEEAVFLIRRLPLAAGYKTTLPLVSPVGMLIKLPVSITGEKDIEVPAGKFHCWQLEFENIAQKFYLNTAPPRQIVKIEAGTVGFELMSSRMIDRVSPVPYQDKTVGLAFAATPGWVVQHGGNPKPGESNIKLLDPQGRGAAAVWAGNKTTEPQVIAQKLLSGVDDKMRNRATEYKDYKLRPGSVQQRQIGGQAAVSCIADFVEGDRKMAEYQVWIQTPETRVQFYARAAAADFDDLRQRFDLIIETAKLK